MKFTLKGIQQTEVDMSIPIYPDMTRDDAIEELMARVWELGDLLPEAEKLTERGVERMAERFIVEDLPFKDLEGDCYLVFDLG